MFTYRHYLLALATALLGVVCVGLYRTKVGPPAGPAVLELQGFIEARHHGGAVAFSRDAKSLALPKRDGSVQVWDLAARSVDVLVSSLNAQTAADLAVFSSDGQSLAVLYRGTGIAVWDLRAKREVVRVTISRPQFVHDMAFADGGRNLVTMVASVTDEDRKGGRMNYSAIHWDPSTGAEQLRQDFDPFLLFKALSSDGRYVVLEHEALANTVFDVSTGKKVSDVLAFGGFCFSADGSVVVSYSGKRIALWDVRSGTQLRRFAFPTSYLTPGYEDTGRVSLSHDNKLLAIGMFIHVNQVGIISLESGKVLGTFECCPPRMICHLVRFSPTGRILATDTNDVNLDDQNVAPLLRFWKIPSSW